MFSVFYLIGMYFWFLFLLSKLKKMKSARIIPFLIMVAFYPIFLFILVWRISLIKRSDKHSPKWYLKLTNKVYFELELTEGNFIKKEFVIIGLERVYL